MDRVSMCLGSEQLVIYDPDQIFMYQFLRPCQKILVQHTNAWSLHKQCKRTSILRCACQTIDGLVTSVFYIKNREEHAKRLRLALFGGGLVPVLDCVYATPDATTEDMLHCLHHRRQMQHYVLAFLERLAVYYRHLADDSSTQCSELVAEGIAYAQGYNPGETSLLVD